MFRRRPSLTTLLVAAVLALAVVLGFTERPDQLFLDAWFRLRGFRPSQGDIVIVKLGQDFVDAYNFRIGDLDRSFYARALDNLNTAGTRVVGVDLFFPEQSASQGNHNPDTELAEAILKRQRCFAAGTYPKGRPPREAIAKTITSPFIRFAQRQRSAAF